jgi:ATP-binding cassette subfamily B protein
MSVNHTQHKASDPLQPLTWPASRAAEALAALARRSGLAPRLPGTRTRGETLDEWIAAASRLGMEVEPVEAPYAGVESLVRGAAPALLRLPGRPDNSRPGYLALLRGGRRSVTLLAPSGSIHRVRVAQVRAALCGAIETPLRPEIQRLLEEADVPARRRARAEAALLREHLGTEPVGGCWLLRPSPGAGAWRQLGQARLPQRLGLYLGAHAAQTGLWLIAWVLLGRAAQEGRFDRGWFLAWALLLLTIVPLNALVTWIEGRLATGAGALLKRRLLYGTLRLEPDEIRHQGAGQLLGRVIESEAVEALALSGGFLTLLAGIELLAATAVLLAGAGGTLHALVLWAWAALTALLAWRYHRRRDRWTATRLDMTHDLIEKMVGQRTRLAQQQRERWHTGEDEALSRYVALSGELDRAVAPLLVLGDGWLIVGLLGLAPALVSARADLATGAALAVGLGGVLLAQQALSGLGQGLMRLLDARIAWQRVGPLYRAASRPEGTGTLDRADSVPQAAPGALPVLLTGTPADRGTTAGDEAAVVDARELVFRYHARAAPVLRRCSLRIRAGERVLLEGASGSGKSTLAAVLGGQRRPQSGQILLRGHDLSALGAAAWRRRVAVAPQFHENHVLTDSLAFNLLMGGRWPPREQDLDAAEAVCRELGLGPLLDRMPAGLQQQVGEGGWRLSHGEKSRLYIARALLQGAELIVLDESFAALDPESLRQALVCVLERAPSLLVIAHP